MAVLSDKQREAGWTIVKLGDIAPLNYGKSLVASKRIPGDVPVYSSAGLIDSHNEAIIDGQNIIIGRKGTIGSITWSEGPAYPIDTTFYTAGTDKVNIKYLYYLLKTYNFSEMNTDSAVPGLNRVTFESQDALLPPLEEQERIAGILGSLDDKIEANTHLIQTLDSLGEAVVSKYLKSVHGTQKLNTIAHIVMGQSPKGDTLNTDGDGILFFQGKKDFGFRYPTPRTYTTAPTRMAEPLDILFSVRAPIGALNRSVEACCVGRGLAAIRSSCGQENTLFYTLKTNPGLWEKFEGEGTIFSAINKKGLSELDIPFSEEAASNGIESFLTSVEQGIFSLEQENLQLASTRDALIKRLIG